MALLKGNVKEIPADAVILTEKEAVQYQAGILKKWKNKWDVWAINHGTTILASTSALAGIYINNHYRMMFRLFHYGQIATYLPVCVLPSMMCAFIHNEFVLPSVVLQKNCPVCIEMRAAALQATLGCIFPTVLAVTAISSLAVRYATYNVPSFGKEPLKLVQLWRKQTKPIGNVMFAIFVGQALLGSLITYFEAKNVERVNEKLTLLGYDLERQDEL